MGADITWIIERQHRDGSWEAVTSEAWCNCLAHPRNWADPHIWDQPDMAFGNRNYTLFGILSGVRGKIEGQKRHLAHNGLPKDASAHARAAFAGKRGLHSRGWLTMGELRAGCDDPKVAPAPDDREALRDWLAALDRLISGPDALVLDEILEGPTSSDDGNERFPQMQARSNHHKLTQSERAAGLLPVSDDTLRVIIAYDS